MKKNAGSILGSLAVVMMMAATLTISGPAPVAAGDTPMPMAIPADQSCGVCGMMPAKFPKWQAQVIFTDGSMVPFDGCKDMFKYVLDMSAYDKAHSAGDIAAVWVKDYNTGNWIDGKTATYVVGSKVMGPMGKELIPFGAGGDADSFMKENEGAIDSYEAIDMAKVKKLGMGGMMMKGMKGKM